MSMSMNFTLGGTLQSDLVGANNGVYLYAFAFDGNGNLIDSTTIISDGALVSGGTTLDLNPSNSIVKGGNVVIALQELPSASPYNVPLNPHTIGDILDPTAATNGNYRYDAVEYTISGTASDVADLTNIVQFGAPMELSVTYNPGPSQTIQTRGYAVSGATLANAVTNTLSPPGVQDYDWNPASPYSGQRELLGLANNAYPADANPLNNPAEWTNYVTAFESLVSGGSNSPVYIANYFSASAGSSGGASALGYFQVQYDSGFQASEGGTFWLVPVDLNITTAIGQVPYTIGVSAQDLQSNIITQTGQLEVYTAVRGTPVTLPPPASFTPNDAYGDIVKFFVAGFDGGFWGGSANYINPNTVSSGVAGTLNLNQNWNWTGDYAYHATDQSGMGNYGYTNSFGSNAGYDKYAQYFYQNTNAYSYSYSDLISYGGGLNPQISLWDPSLNGNTGANVSDIAVTLFNWTDTPTGHSPSQPNLQTVTQAADTLSGLELLFDLSLNAAVGPVNGTPITFRAYAPGDTSPLMNGDFLEFKLPTTGDYNLAYTIGGSAGAWTFTAGGSLVQPGYIIINNVPVIDAATINWNWYQLVVGDGLPQEKIFNLYVNADGTTISQLMVDGGAFSQLIANETNQGKFAFVPGGVITYSPELWNSVGQAPTPAPLQTLVAPLIGTLDSAGDFGAFPALDNLKDGKVAFSWQVGNKVVGGYYVKLEIADVDHPDWALMPLASQSSAGGDWLTDVSSQFGNGTYSAFMSQYRLKDPGLVTPVVASSVNAEFTVNLDTLNLGGVDGGSALGLDQGGSTTTGNWIDLHALSSTLPNATLLAYATDAAGNLIDRGDGHVGADVTLDDAVLGRFGMVKDDKGGLLFAGDHAIYLRAGYELHFGIESGNGVVQQTPAVHVSGSGSVAVTVDGDGGSLQFSAQVNNTLSGDDVLAGAQRLNDAPLAYIAQGSTVHVEVAGSANNVNTVHFIHIDVNPITDAWSVGGVAYGNTDAFRAAVQQNWDPGFAVQNGNGTFHTGENWTIAGTTGFYAPVLVTQAGDIFVIGTANVDGREHIRSFGENMFGFEDLRADQGSDFDYNDMVVHLSVL
jgi:hypothetical protein